MSGPLAPMSERYRRPDWVRRINAMAASVGGDARQLVRIDAAELMEAALAGVGAKPAGDLGDPQWTSRFESLVAAIDGADLTVVGRLVTKQELLRALRTRLLLCRALDDDPGIADERIEAPVVVTGPARSGTSILFELLWLDPALRAPLAWEALHPIPLPGDGPDRRLAASECEQELWADIQPEFAAIHELRSDLPVECVTLTAPCFCGPHWPMVVQAPGIAADDEVMYGFHRRILQVLQRGCEPRTWLLKTPSHLMTLPRLFATYPDAWVVQTHRDPAKTMPSTVSTTAMVQWMRHETQDVVLLSQAVAAVFIAALNGVVEQREQGSLPPRFVDVHFQSLLRDPVETLRKAYADMGRAFGDDHAERIRAYLANKPQGKFGVHRYTPEEWGFTADGLRAQAARYVDYFGVAPES